MLDSSFLVLYGTVAAHLQSEHSYWDSQANKPLAMRFGLKVLLWLILNQSNKEKIGVAMGLKRFTSQWLINVEWLFDQTNIFWMFHDFGTIFGGIYLLNNTRKKVCSQLDLLNNINKRIKKIIITYIYWICWYIACLDHKLSKTGLFEKVFSLDKFYVESSSKR